MSSGIDQTWGAIAAYAKWAAVDFVPVGAEPLVGIYETEGWQAAPDGALRRGITKQTFSHGLFEALQSANPELYRTTRDALRADDRFGEWDGGMVGTAMSSSGFSVDQIVSSCVAAQITSDGEFLPDEAKVRATYDEIVQWFTSPHQKATALIPLPGLKVAAGGDSFELEPGIVFGRFSDEEFVTLARLDVISSGFGDFPLINEAYRFGCRIEIEMPTRFQTQADLQAEPAPTTPATRRFGQRTSWAFNDLDD